MVGQAVGVSIPHTSIPRDQRDPAAASGTRLLVVLERPDAAPDEWRQLLGSGCEVRCLDGDPTAFERTIAEQLGAARVGLRLHVAGSDAFTRRIQQLAFDAGMLPAEIRAATSDEEIRVWCTHCKAITEAPAANLLKCGGCGRQLLVYHHFSKRHGAYMGFQADAEAHGELPQREPGMPWA